MVSKSSSDSSASKMKISLGEQSDERVVSLSHKMNQLKKQIQAERVVSIREKVEKNRKKLDTDVSQLILEISRRTTMFTGQNGVAKMLSSRASNPLHKFAGVHQGLGERDYVNGHDVVLGSMGTKLPYVEKIPPYTTWIFLDKNQRMAEDQSVVGRRRIYYDQNGSEALICSDSEEDLIEAEEEKHEFSEGEDRIIWALLQEFGLAEELMNVVSQFVGVCTSEIEERFGILKEKYEEEENAKDSGDSGYGRGISLDKSLDAALDSFDNLFCRRCLVFDCRLHGCSQTLINPSEKQPYWSEYEDDRKPCSNQCFLRLRAAKELSAGSVDKTFHRTRTATIEKPKTIVSASDAEEAPPIDIIVREEKYDSDKERATTLEAVNQCELGSGTSDMSADTALNDSEPLRKRKVSQQPHKALDDSIEIPDDTTSSPSKKQKNILPLPVVTEAVEEAVEGIPGLDHRSSDKSITDKSEPHMSSKKMNYDSGEHVPEKLTCSNTGENISDEAKDVTKVPELNQVPSIERKVEGVPCRSEWKPIEKELYLKGVEIFGKNSCLIARNLLSGLKTCVEVSNYMCDSGASVPHRSVASRSFLADNEKDDANYTEQEMPTRTRLIRRRGRTRKLKYSWKSAGHPSMWKRIADGKNQSCKQYTPCGCQSMCGKQCPCLNNGTCCEKYCGCSKSCKNRFRGCHCAKSQCRSRQCPCFAAGRECDPDVCRNCWVSCGDGSLGEPPKRGDAQCGNMRLLLRQQQRILLAKSDVAGWGAFLKNSVNKNDYLGEYTGELISHREADKRGKIYDRANSSFLFDLNDQYVLDAYRKGDKLKFANHSSNPNCYAKVMLVAGDHRVGIFAKEHIDASQELFYDYRYGPDQAPAWARKPEGSKREDSTLSQGRAKKHQSHS